MQTNTSSTDRQAIFDIVKYVLALMIVAIHSSLFPMILYPWLRLAVPLFFMISSYFFFGNLRRFETIEEKNKRWWRYVKRNLILYGFWFVALLPYTLLLRNYFDEGVLRGILKFLKSLFFGSTFPASWFIQASIIAVTIVFWASKKIKSGYLLVFSIFLYCFAVIKSSYWNLFESLVPVNSIYAGYDLLFSSPMFNLPAALIWIVIGKYFAEEKIWIKKTIVIIGLLVSGVLLYLEWLVVRTMNGSFNNDCYFLLIPSSFFIFELVRSIKVSPNRITNFCGRSSILIYTTHIPAISVISFLLNRLLSITSRIWIFSAVVILCTLGSYVVFKLEKVKAFKWLKYSH